MFPNKNDTSRDESNSKNFYLLQNTSVLHGSWQSSDATRILIYRDTKQFEWEISKSIVLS